MFLHHWHWRKTRVKQEIFVGRVRETQEGNMQHRSDTPAVLRRSDIPESFWLWCSCISRKSRDTGPLVTPECASNSLWSNHARLTFLRKLLRMLVVNAWCLYNGSSFATSAIRKRFSFYFPHNAGQFLLNVHRKQLLHNNTIRTELTGINFARPQTKSLASISEVYTSNLRCADDRHEGRGHFSPSHVFKKKKMDYGLREWFD